MVPLLNLDGKPGNEVESRLGAKCSLELTLTPMEISLNDTKLNPSDRQALTQRAVKCGRCSTCERMSRACSHRPSRNQADGEHFNEKLFVDLCDLVSVHGNRHRWLVAVDRHTDYTVIAPCPNRQSQAAAKEWRTERCCIKWGASVVAGSRESPTTRVFGQQRKVYGELAEHELSRFPFERGRQKRPAGGAFCLSLGHQGERSWKDMSLHR